MTSILEKWVGCFRTCCLSHILNMYSGYKATLPKEYENVDIVKLTSSRRKELHKDIIRPYPYLTIENISRKSGKLEYEWRRHGRIDAKGILKVLGNSGIQEMVVDNISFMMPKEWIFEKAEIEKELAIKKWFNRVSRCVATFESRFIQAEMDRELRKAVAEVMNEEIKDYKFKHSVLDLVGVADARAWYTGIMNEFHDLETNSRRLRWVLRQLDPDGNLGYLRQYRMEEGKYWRLIKVASVKEW